MRNTITKGVLAAVLASLAQPSLADTAETKGGLTVKTDDGRFEMKIGGRIHFDTYVVDEDRSATFGSLARRSLVFPRSNIGPERSMPTTSAAPVLARGTVTRPVPHPSSSTRPPRAVTTRCQNATSLRPNVRAFSQS